MPTTTSKSGVLVEVQAGRRLSVSTPGEAAVDIVAGAFGAGNKVERISNATALFGPYGSKVTLRVRSANGSDVVTYDDALVNVTVQAEVDPVSGAPSGKLVAKDGTAFSSCPLVVTGGDQIGDVQTATFLNGSGTLQWARVNASTGASTDIAGQTAATYTRALADLGFIVTAYSPVYSPRALGRVTRAAAPSVPQSVAVVAGNGSALVSWAAPANNGGAAVAGYLLTVFPSGAQYPVPSASTSFSVPSLTNKSDYTINVQAFNDVGISPAVATSTVTPLNLKFVTTQNRLSPSTGTVPAGRVELNGYVSLIIGSGQVNGITLTWANWAASAPDSTATSPINLAGMYLENSAATAQVAVPVAGQNFPYALASGAQDVRHAKILPSAFGLTQFQVGDKYYMKFRATLTSGATYPNMLDRIPSGTDAKNLWTLSDPTTIQSSPLTTLGRQTATLVAGGATTTFPATSNGGFCPFVLGEFADEIPKRRPTSAMLADSNGVGFQDTDTLVHGKGVHQRALAGDGSVNQLMAGATLGATGFTINQVNHPKIVYWAQFSDVVVQQVLGNTFGSDGLTSQAQARIDIQAMWDAIHLVNPKAEVFSCKVGPHTSGATFTAADQSDQTVQPGYVQGGNVDIFTDWQILQAGKPNCYDRLISWDQWHSYGDYRKMPPNTSPDGVHDINTSCAVRGAQLRLNILDAFGMH